jgi:hypothetical protein
MRDDPARIRAAALPDGESGARHPIRHPTAVA